MRPLAPDAGRLGRAATLVTAIVASIMAGCVATATPTARTSETTAAPPLLPQAIIAGGFSARADALPSQPANGPYIKLMYPAAVAANGPDLYVADIGQRMLLRIDAITQGVTRLRELPALPGVRLASERDGSVYVVSPGTRNVERLARDGRRLAVFSEKYELLQPADVTVGPDGRLWLSDAAGGVFAFHPSGRMGEPLVGRGDGFPDELLGGATLLAAGRDAVFGYDPACRCIQVFARNGAPLGRFGEEDQLNPVDLAVDPYERVWIIDEGGRLLKIYADWRLAATVEPARLGLTSITGLAIDAHLAYLADGPGGKIGVFAISPPPQK